MCHPERSSCLASRSSYQGPLYPSPSPAFEKLDFQDLRKFRFPESHNAKNFAQGAAIEMRDANGHHIELKREAHVIWKR